MTSALPGKREQNVARTRDKLVDAAVELYGSRSIDAVSLREIGAAAGQKNPNALQYHFGDRDGLLQAIVDKHALAITQIRERYISRAEAGEWPPGEAAARCLVMPIIEYVDTHAQGISYVRIVSQLAAVYQSGEVPGGERSIRFPGNERLVAVFNKALARVSGREAQRRIYLVVTNTFHSIADIYRAAEQHPANSPVASRKPMVEQLILLLNAFFSAPSCR
jgi:AcrR family transcriptional regulator